MRLEKYKQNLRIEGNKVLSYITHVATIKGSGILIAEFAIDGTDDEGAKL